MKKNILSLLFLVPYILWAQNSSDNIVFADPNVKSICVSNWDTNGDGELSYEEAAAVTGIGTVFKLKKSITSFDELQYFTGITSIDKEAFSLCSDLTSITIPEGVTSIGYRAFMYCTNLTSITIPEGVTLIDNNAFEDCNALTSITIPEGVTAIRAYTFRSCNALTSINIPEGVNSIVGGAFLGCSSLTSITIPENVTFIGDQAFSGCSSLTSITIPKGVTIIDYDTFSGCSSLTNITIPDGVTSIGNDAFSYCRNLTSITIPEGVTSIGGDAFSGCTGLTSITIPEGVTSIGYNAFSGCSSLINITIPEGVTSIDSNTFEGCTSLTSIIIPEGVTSINKYAFQDCSSLTSITIPDGVTSIGEYAFSGCNGLTSITIPSSVTSIGNRAFSGCTGLASISVDSSNQYYNDGNGRNCIIKTSTNTLVAGCKNTVIPSNVTSIGGSAFSGCSGLTSITIPSNVTSIGTSAFESCTGLTSITIPESVTLISTDAFRSCSSLTSITSNIKSPFKFSLWAFNQISSSCVLYVPAGTRDAYIAAGWTEDVFKGGVVEMSDREQSLELTELPTMTYGDGSYNLPSATDQGLALTWSSNNTSVATVSGNTLTVKGAGEASVTAANDGDTTHNPFSKSYTLTVDKAVLTVTADDCSRMEGYANPTFTISYSGFKYNDNVSSLTTQPTAASEATNSSPAGIYPISVSGASADNYSITYVNGSLTVLEYDENLPIQFADPNVKSICVSNWDSNGDGELSYEEAAAVTDIGNLFTANDVITSFDELQYFTGLSSIRNRAFFNCVSLSSIIIPEGVTSIGEDAFAGCNSLPVVNNIRYAGPYLVGATDKTLPTYTIREGTRYIGISAFQNCSNLVEITIPEGVTSIGNYAFENCSSLTNITIPESVISIGEYAFRGCNGLTSITIPEGVTSIGEYAFRGCNGLTSITIPEGVTSIGKYAFSGCSSLVEITISEGVTSIGNYAFENCSSLTNITIPESVISIGEYAFSGCSSLPVENNIRYADTYLVEAINKTLSTYTIKDDTRFIGRYAFKECTALTSITIPEGVTSIGYGAFSGCSNLVEITIPEGVTSIGEYAFSGCSNLVEITIPESVISIGNGAFSGCSSLPVENNIRYAGPYLVEAADKTLSTYTIREGTRFIGSSAFYNCSSLTSITIPEGVTSIQNSAFKYCSSLTSITIPEGVTSIQDSAFFRCSSLTSITIPDGVTSIGRSAFRYCSLTSITIPESVNSIGNAAFVNTFIRTVKVCNSTPFPYDGFSLNSISIPVIVLIVPASALSAYKTAKGWKDFDYIVCEEDYLNSLKISDLTVEHGAEINLPVSMTNPEQITAVEFDLWVPNGIKLLGCSMTERKNGHEINYVQNGNDCHVTIFSLTSSAIDGNDGELLNLKLLAESEGSFGLRIQNIEFSTKEGERRNPPYSRSATVTINDIPLGDVNGDGEVTITDAVSIVNHRLDRTPVRFISVAADLNADNEITITDAVRIVNMILSDQSNAKLRTESAISLPEPQ